MSRLILTNINQLVTVAGEAPKKGKAMRDVGEIINGCIVIDDDSFSWVGTMDDFYQSTYSINDKSPQYIDCTGRCVLPGFIDSHTHFIFGGYRAQEFNLRLAGASYMDIMKAGGGIHYTVQKTREASFESLYELGKNRLDEMLLMGVTTVEGKSGYGLDFENEIKQLRVMKALNETHKIDIISTYMGPHSIPKEYKDKEEGSYIDFVVNEVLPFVAEKSLASFADIFCEKDVFSIQEAEYYLMRAKELGLALKIHADEIVDLGGALLGAKLGATSADHLLMTSTEGIQALSRSSTIATLLPATAFSLKEPYGKAREMMDAGVALALATDFNPGSSPTYSIPLVIALAALQMGMTTEEIVCALTINAACALGIQQRVGSIEVGKKADVIILSRPSIDYLPYHMGMNLVEIVIKNGQILKKVWIENEKSKFN